MAMQSAEPNAARAALYPGSDAYTEEELREVGAEALVQPEGLSRPDRTAFIRFGRPDLDLAERFLNDFGLVTACRTTEALYLRGTSAEPFVCLIERRPQPSFIGVAFHLNTVEELERLAADLALAVTPSTHPGRGKSLTLIDPAGFEVTLLAEQNSVEPLNARKEPFAYNTPDKKARVNEPVRPDLEPTPLVRFGHVVMRTSKFLETLQWYMSRLGMIATDVFCLSDGIPQMAFLRLDRGSKPADHHSLVLFGAPGPPAFLHCAFEAVDIDALGQGQQILKSNGWTHHWGIGRHIFGSQLFDYWKDPWGDEWEHYADGDVFDASYPTQYHILDRGGLWMWGDDLPPSMRPKPSLGEIASTVWGTLSGQIDAAELKQLQKAMGRRPRPWLK